MENVALTRDAGDEGQDCDSLVAAEDEEPESDSGVKEETADGWDWGIGC